MVPLVTRVREAYFSYIWFTVAGCAFRLPLLSVSYLCLFALLPPCAGMPGAVLEAPKNWPDDKTWHPKTPCVLLSHTCMHVCMRVWVCICACGAPDIGNTVRGLRILASPHKMALSTRYCERTVMYSTSCAADVFAAAASCCAQAGGCAAPVCPAGPCAVRTGEEGQAAPAWSGRAGPWCDEIWLCREAFSPLLPGCFFLLVFQYLHLFLRAGFKKPHAPDGFWIRACVPAFQSPTTSAWLLINLSISVSLAAKRT